ncbi:MAG: hypothetical protein M5R40_05420 [Anaerolineae bacterium]|nr:hypothetical protein [Anaerolineae bacterium]
MTDKKVLRGAMLGTGTISYHHLVAWQRIPGVEIVAPVQPEHREGPEASRRVRH